MRLMFNKGCIVLGSDGKRTTQHNKSKTHKRQARAASGEGLEVSRVVLLINVCCIK